MKTEVENLEPTRVKLTVETPYEEIAPAIDKAYREVASQINIPGFRKGKAPKQIIDQRVGRGIVLEQAVNEVLPQLYRDAVTEQNLAVLSQPTIDVTEIPNATGELGGNLIFTAEVDVRPEIVFPDLSNVELSVDNASVSDDDVEEKLTELRQRFGSLVGVDRAIEDGDFVTIDLKAEIDGEEIDSVSGVSYEVGSGSMLEGMDEALIGAEANEEKSFTTKLLGGEHAGEEASCTITATAVKERDLPEADDEFAELASEFDTIDELREDLRVQAEKDAASAQALAARDKLLDHLRETVEFPLPEGVIDAEIAEHLAQEGKDADDEHGKEIRPDIENALRDQLLLDALAEKHEVGVEQNELIEFMMMTAQQYGIDPNQFFSGAAESGQIPAFMAEIRRNKSLIAALKEVTVKDEDGNELDLSAFLGNDDASEESAESAESVDSADSAEETDEK
ncbi:trigger factor [Bowdeniella massiliensis]|uniref:trigger factor n=1 Tax=Bowdeniella massiliensis TaxID=2932264 RepID=UPI002029665E